MPLWWGIPLVDFAGLPGRHFFFKPLELWESCLRALFRCFRSVPGSWTCTTPIFPIKNLLFLHHDSLQKKGLPTLSFQGFSRGLEITNSNTAMFNDKKNPSQISINICIKFDSPPKRKWVLQWPHHINHHWKQLPCTGFQYGIHSYSSIFLPPMAVTGNRPPAFFPTKKKNDGKNASPTSPKATLPGVEVC